MKHHVGIDSVDVFARGKTSGPGFNPVGYIIVDLDAPWREVDELSILRLKHGAALVAGCLRDPLQAQLTNDARVVEDEEPVVARIARILAGNDPQWAIGNGVALIPRLLDVAQEGQFAQRFPRLAQMVGEPHVVLPRDRAVRTGKPSAR